MKKFVFFTCLCLSFFLVFQVLAKEPKIKKSRFFDAIKIYNDTEYVLHDTLEFTVFDMAETKIINNSPQIKTNTDPVTNQDTYLDAEAEIHQYLSSLPKYFYTSLKNQILQQAVPVTLYPANAPDYSLPLKLYIKLKRIQLKAPIKTTKGAYAQPVEFRIYGQIKNKKTDQVIIKYYDTCVTNFLLNNNQAEKALENLSNSLMKDLALFLRTNY